MGLQQATATNKLAAEKLDAAQEDLDFERHEEIRAAALGDLFLRGFDTARLEFSPLPDGLSLAGGVL